MRATMDAIGRGKKMGKRIGLLTQANEMYGQKTCKDQ